MKPSLLQQAFASYERYYSQRLLPGAALLSYAGMGVIVLFLLADLWHLGLGSGFAGMALASVLSCGLIGWMAHSMQHPSYETHRIHWVLWLGNLAMVVMMAGNILVLGRLSYLPMIVMYFMLGVLLIAPLVAPLAFLLPHLASVLLAGGVMWLKGYQLAHWLQLLLFSMPAMAFMLMILSVQRRTAMQSYQIARQNWFYATTDPLSQLQNRRTWYEAAEAALAEAVTQARPLALLMLDIDHFKTINDQWGHVAGDKVIEQVGRTAPWQAAWAARSLPCCCRIRRMQMHYSPPKPCAPAWRRSWYQSKASNCVLRSASACPACKPIAWASWCARRTAACTRPRQTAVTGW